MAPAKTDVLQGTITPLVLKTLDHDPVPFPASWTLLYASLSQHPHAPASKESVPDRCWSPTGVRES